MSLLDEIRRHEGFRAKPYRDTEGKLTVGYGTLLEDGISREEADAMLRIRLRVMVDELRKSPVRDTFDALPASVQDAIKNMAYNLGVPRLLLFRKMWAALARHDYRAAAAEALDSKWARQVGVRADDIAGESRRGQ